MSIRDRANFVFSALVAAALITVSGCAGAGTPSMSQQPLQSGANQAFPMHAQPAAAQTWFLSVGGNDRGQAFQALNFFSDSITIDQGDSITWTVGGNAHTITFFGPEHAPKSPVNDPFGSHHYDGSKYTSSGIMFPGQTYTLKFIKPGSYPYECLFHDPEMAGVVNVNPIGAPYPHPQSYYDEQGNIERGQELAGARGSVAEFPYPDRGTSLAAGIAPGLSQGQSSNSTVLRFLDADVVDNGVVKIAVGTTLTWNNLSNNEPHTVTFPRAGQPLPKWLKPFGHAYGGPTYDGTHLASSGPLFPGQSYSLTFTGPGTFTYYCLIHAPFGMAGTVIVH
jgi:plastocyanin